LVLLGVAVYRRLGRNEQAAVDREVQRMLEPAGVAFPSFEVNFPVPLKAAYRAIAMHRLGFATGSPLFSWEKLQADGPLPALLSSFRRSSPELGEARRALQAAGFSLSEDEPSQAAEEQAIFARAHDDA
jgi:hypothetical protein